MSFSIDLDAYLERVKLRGPIRPNWQGLVAMLQAHMASIPFENLDVLLGRPIRLDLDGIQTKLVHGRRGGYCFEHASLFAAVLESIGFAPRRHSARVVMATALAQAPRTHMFLSLCLDGERFVLDPGFGSLAPRLPVPLVEGVEVQCGDEAHWMSREDGMWMLNARNPAKTVAAWVSTLEDEQPADFLMGNHYTSTFPGSPFVNRLLLRALTADGQVGVMNRELTVRSGGAVETRLIADRAELRSLLVQHFGFDLPEVEQVRVPGIPEWQ